MKLPLVTQKLRLSSTRRGDYRAVDLDETDAFFEERITPALVTFGPYAPTGNQRGEIQIFLEDEDRVDEIVQEVAASPTDIAYVTTGWHVSPNDPALHLRVELQNSNGATYATCHVYPNGQVTCF
jgi:hypothetical protein